MQPSTSYWAYIEVSITKLPNFAQAIELRTSYRAIELRTTSYWRSSFIQAIELSSSAYYKATKLSHCKENGSQLLALQRFFPCGFPGLALGASYTYTASYTLQRIKNNINGAIDWADQHLTDQWWTFYSLSSWWASLASSTSSSLISRAWAGACASLIDLSREMPKSYGPNTALKQILLYSMRPLWCIDNSFYSSI